MHSTSPATNSVCLKSCSLNPAASFPAINSCPPPGRNPAPASTAPSTPTSKPCEQNSAPSTKPPTPSKPTAAWATHYANKTHNPFRHRAHRARIRSAQRNLDHRSLHLVRSLSRPSFLLRDLCVRAPCPLWPNSESELA